MRNAVPAPPVTRLLRCLAVACVLAAISGNTAHAQDPYHCIEDLSDDEVRYRIDKIEKTFAQGKRKAVGWRIGWSVGSAALATAVTTTAIIAARDGRTPDKFAGAYLAAGGFFASARLLLTPMPGAWGLKRIRRMPDETEAQRRAKLLYATQKLEQNAKIETFNSGPGTVLFSSVYAVVGGTVKAVKWTGSSREVTALMFILPPVIATSAVLTAPKNARPAWEEYRGLACSGKYYDRGRDDLDLDLSVGPQGFSLRLAF
jgi:hypothetical protein